MCLMTLRFVQGRKVEWRGLWQNDHHLPCSLWQLVLSLQFVQHWNFKFTVTRHFKYLRKARYQNFIEVWIVLEISSFSIWVSVFKNYLHLACGPQIWDICLRMDGQLDPESKQNIENHYKGQWKWGRACSYRIIKYQNATFIEHFAIDSFVLSPFYVHDLMWSSTSFMFSFLLQGMDGNCGPESLVTCPKAAQLIRDEAMI